MSKKGTHITEYGLEFEFTVWEDSGDYSTPSYHSVEIDKIIYNDIDLTDLLFDVANEYVENIREIIEENN